LSITY